MNVECRLEVLSSSVHVQAFARSYGKTGVEMEALMAVSAALLCIHDLTKMYNAASRIGDITLVEKKGGKSGHWKNSGLSSLSELSELSNPSNASNAADLQPLGNGVVSANTSLSLHGTSVALLTVSDTCAKHPDRDVSGKILREFFENKGAQHTLDQLAELSAAQLKQWLVKQMLSPPNTMGTELLMHSAVAVNADILQDHEPLRPYVLKVTPGLPLEIALLPPVSGG